MRVVGFGRHLFGSPFMGQPQKKRWYDWPVFQCYVVGHCQNGIPVTLAPDQWGISDSNASEKNDLIGKNAQVIWDALSKYPYPAPFFAGEGVAWFRKDLKGDLKDLANMDQILDTDTVDIWITLQVLRNYGTWTSEMEANEKEMAKRRKKIAMRNAIAEAVAAIIVGIAAPAAVMAIISAVHAAEQAYMDKKKAEEAAKSLREAAAAFGKSDPEFAKQVDRAGDIVDLISGNQAGSSVPPPGAPVPSETATPSSTGTTLAVGGGVVAAGLAAFAIFGR